LEEKEQKQLNTFLYQLEQKVKSPPIAFDYMEWKEDVEEIAKKIKEISLTSYEGIEGLLENILADAENYNTCLIEEGRISEMEYLRTKYFAEVGFIISEINRAKLI